VSSPLIISRTVDGLIVVADPDEVVVSPLTRTVVTDPDEPITLVGKLNMPWVIPGKVMVCVELAAVIVMPLTARSEMVVTPPLTNWTTVEGAIKVPIPETVVL
jgi:hypothetical protein